MWGLGFGLPALYHPDEPAYVLQALAVARGLPDGLTFANPPLYKYVLLAEYAVVYAIDRLVGVVGSPQDFIDRFRADPTQLYLIARLTSALFGAATVGAAFALAATLHGRRAGLIAAWLAATAFLLVRDSHFGVNDALVTLLVTLGLVWCVRIARGGGRVDYVLAGLLAGLAFAAKYTGIALLAPLILAHAVRPAPRRARELGLAFGACALAAVCAFPSLVTEPGRVINDVYVHLYLGASGGYDGLDPSGGYPFYARVLLVGLGAPMLVAVVIGLAVSIARSRRPCQRAELVVAVLPLSMIAVLGAQQMYFARFVLPAVPPLLVLAAVAVDRFAARAPRLAAAAAVLIVVPTLVDAVRLDALLTRDDTRALASAWLDANVAPGVMLAVDSAPLGPALSESKHNLFVANAFSLFDLSPADYRAQGVSYVVVSSFAAEARAIDPAREARRRAFNAALPAQAQEVAEFRPYDDGQPAPPFVYDAIYGPFDALDRLARPGPNITVYRLAP